MSFFLKYKASAGVSKQMGVTVLDGVDEHFSKIIENWYADKNTNPEIKANNIQETLQLLFDTYPTKKKIEKEEVALFI